MFQIGNFVRAHAQIPSGNFRSGNKNYIFFENSVRKKSFGEICTDFINAALKITHHSQTDSSVPQRINYCISIADH